MDLPVENVFVPSTSSSPNGNQSRDVYSDILSRNYYQSRLIANKDSPPTYGYVPWMNYVPNFAAMGYQQPHYWSQSPVPYSIVPSWNHYITNELGAVVDEHAKADLDDIHAASCSQEETTKDQNLMMSEPVPLCKNAVVQPQQHPEEYATQAEAVITIEEEAAKLTLDKQNLLVMADAAQLYELAFKSSNPADIKRNENKNLDLIADVALNYDLFTRPSDFVEKYPFIKTYCEREEDGIEKLETIYIDDDDMDDTLEIDVVNNN